MSTNTEPPPQLRPPDKLERDRRGGKAIFFTLDTLFDRELANERGLEKCKRLCSRFRGKSMDELKRAYHHAMASAYRNHIQAHLPGVVSQASVDKVELMFRELNLNPPSTDDKSLIGSAFAAGFNCNRFEVFGASRTLEQLKKLEYTIVVADDYLEWDTVKGLYFWRYIDAMIVTTDMVRPKPDRSVFKNALDACGVAPKNAVIVGCSIDKDIAGILNAQAEPILYMPGHNSMDMNVQGTRVLVVRSMAELLSKICDRPENRHLVPAQRHQLPPPPMPPASQAQEYANDQDDGSSSQHRHGGSGQSQRPASDPKSTGDRHASPSWGKAPLARRPSHPGSSNETPERHRLPDRGHPPKCYESTARLAPSSSYTPAKRPYEAPSGHGYVPPSYHSQGYPERGQPRGHHNPTGRQSPGPSTQTSSPDTPQLTGQPMGPNSDGSAKSSAESSTPVYSPPSPPTTLLPSMRMFPPTRDYGITMPTYVENQHQPRSHYDGYGHGTSRNRYSTHVGYTTLPPLRSWYQPPTTNHSTYWERSTGGGHGNGYETSGNKYPPRGGYALRSPSPYQAFNPSAARHQGQYESWYPGHPGEVSGRSYPTQDAHQAVTPSPRQAPREMSPQVGPSGGMYAEHRRQTFARRAASMYETTPHRSYEIHSARRLSGNWESPVHRGYPRREEQRVRPHHGEVADLTSSTMNGVPSSQALQSTTQDPAIPGDTSRQPSHEDLNNPPERWSTPGPQADKQLKARSSSHDEGSTTDTGSSPDTLTAHSPETAGPDGAAAEPPHERQRRYEGLREIAQVMLDLSRDPPLPRL